MSAHGHNSISNCVRAARTGKEQVSLFTEPTAEPAPLKAKERLLLQSLRAEGPHLQRKAATAVPARAEEAAATTAAPPAPRRDAPVLAKVYASKAERRRAKKHARAPASTAVELVGAAKNKKPKKDAPSSPQEPKKLQAAVMPKKLQAAGKKRKKTVEASDEQDARQPKRRAAGQAGVKDAAGEPSEHVEGDQLQAALAAAAPSAGGITSGRSAGGITSGAASAADAAAEAYTPGCVLKLLQPKSAKGPDGKYPRGYMAGLKEKLGGEAAGLLYAHMVPDSALLYVIFSNPKGAAAAARVKGVGQASVLEGEEEARHWRERARTQAAHAEANQRKGGGAGGGRRGKGDGRGGNGKSTGGGKGKGKGGKGSGEGKGKGKDKGKGHGSGNKASLKASLNRDLPFGVEGMANTGSGKHRGTISF